MKTPFHSEAMTKPDDRKALWRCAIVVAAVIVFWLALFSNARAAEPDGGSMYGRQRAECCGPTTARRRDGISPESPLGAPLGHHQARCCELFGTAAKQRIAESRGHRKPNRHAQVRQANNTVMLPHPAGCPARAFCACGAAVKVFGQSIRSLWPSTAWFKFPRSSPGHMKVAVRPGHVFVIDYMIDNRTAMAWDFNSGGHQSRYHARSISGYAIVDPQASRIARL